MDPYKKFLYKTRKFEIEVTFIQIHDDITPFIKPFVRKLLNMKLEESNLHKYYGDIKKLVDPLVNYWESKIDKGIKTAHANDAIKTKNELFDLLENTIDIELKKQVNFGKDFLPVNSEEEKNCYEQIENLHNIFVANINDYKSFTETLDKEYKIRNFITREMKVSIERICVIMSSIHAFVGSILFENIDPCISCIKEILTQLNRNDRYLKRKEKEYREMIVDELYVANKKKCNIIKNYQLDIADLTEVNDSITKLQKDILNTTNELDCSKYNDLYYQIAYWEKKLSHLEEIQKTLLLLSREAKILQEKQLHYNALTNANVKGIKYKCWIDMADTFMRRDKTLEENMSILCSIIISHFGIGGKDRELFKDHLGEFYKDDYGHKVYYCNYGLNKYHINCNGKLQIREDHDLTFIDRYGRHIFDKKGNKLYQRAPCGSFYTLDYANRFVKKGEKCQHTDDMEHYAINNLKDCLSSSVQEHVDIKNALRPKDMEYLWKSFGFILPDVLNKVYAEQPCDPVQYFAHCLLNQRHKADPTYLREQQTKAAKYIDDTRKNKEKENLAKKIAWKSKQKTKPKKDYLDDYQREVAEAMYTSSAQYRTYAINAGVFS